MNHYDPKRILEECGAVIDGTHVVYASGRHGKAYVNKDAVFLRPEKLSMLTLRMALAFSNGKVDVVAGPAVGGAILAQLVAGHLCNWGAPRRDVMAAYADKTADGGYAFARGYDRVVAGKRVLVVEDVLTTGTTARQVVEAVRRCGGDVVGLAALCNRGGVAAEALGVPALAALIDIALPSWDERACPMCALDVPVRTDIGKGKDFLAKKEKSMQPPYLAIEDLISLIEPPNRTACWCILADNRHLFETVQGSTNNHQAWPGGYIDHVTEVMNVALRLFRCLSEPRPLPFSLSDALLVVYLHDVEKPWKYELGEDGQLHHKPEMKTKADAQSFRERKLAEYGIALTPEQLNGLKYVEGELDDYSSRRRVMGPLAAFCHLCDVTSARIWFDYPAAENDPWSGAGRVRAT